MARPMQPTRQQPPADPTPRPADAATVPITPAGTALDLRRATDRSVSAGQDPRGRVSRFAWLRTFRWRLTLFYAGMLAVLVLVLGLALNLIVGVVLYSDELKSFHSQAKVTVVRQQSHFDALIQGRATAAQGASSVAGVCGTAMSYQQAFADAIDKPLSYQPDFQSAYLLDYFGSVLAPSDDGSAQVGQVGPYITQNALNRLYANALLTRRTALGVLGDYQYTTVAPDGQRVGVVLIADRFHTTSTCLQPRNAPIIGVVEVVTNFADARDTLASLRLVLLLAVLGMFAAGLLIGGPLIGRGLRPLALMAQTARRIASGDLSQRVRLPHGGDEIGQLADTFDEMIARIEAAFGAQAASEAHMRQFIADASHELRTPLTAIRGNIDVLLRGAARDDPATAQQVLVATRREAERMSRLVNDLLTLARLDAGRPLELQPVDLVSLAGEAVDQARILAGQREVSLLTDGGGRLIIPADPDRLKQVLLILLDNALKYGRPEPEGWVRVRLSRTERGAVLTVTDNGQGIAPEDLPHIFDRFYRGERAARHRRMAGSQVPARAAEPPARYDAGSQTASASAPNRPPTGSGLGLAIARAIVQSHGGTLTVESRVGVGTSFTVALPRVQA